MCSRGCKADLTPKTELDNYQIIVNIQEIDLRTESNSTTRREEDVSKKVGSGMTWFGEEMDQGSCRGRPGHGEMRETQEHTGVHTNKTLCQSHWLGKGERLIFVSFCNH